MSDLNFPSAFSEFASFWGLATGSILGFMFTRLRSNGPDRQLTTQQFELDHHSVPHSFEMIVMQSHVRASARTHARASFTAKKKLSWKLIFQIFQFLDKALFLPGIKT